MTYTEYKQLVVEENDHDMVAIIDQCIWFKSEHMKTNDTSYYNFFYVQPTTDACEVIVRMIIEHMKMDIYMGYKVIHRYESSLYVYDSESYIIAHNDQYSDRTRYQPGRMMIMIVVNFVLGKVV